MSIVTCPTTVVNAPAETAWSVLADPAELARWSGSRLLRVPDAPGEVHAGDRLTLAAGWGGIFRVTMQVLEAHPPSRLALDVSLPFGLLNHEVVSITPVDGSACRITFN